MSLVVLDPFNYAAEVTQFYASDNVSIIHSKERHVS